MSKDTKKVADVAPANLEDAIKEIAALKDELSNANSNALEVSSLNEKLKAKVEELTKKLESSTDAEKDKLIGELTERISLLENNQDKKSTLVKDAEGNTYKLRTGKITVPGNAAAKTNARHYTAEQLADSPEIVSALVKMGSGLLVKAN